MLIVPSEACTDISLVPRVLDTTTACQDNPFTTVLPATTECQDNPFTTALPVTTVPITTECLDTTIAAIINTTPSAEPIPTFTTACSTIAPLPSISSQCGPVPSLDPDSIPQLTTAVYNDSILTTINPDRGIVSGAQSFGFSLFIILLLAIFI
ncbi:hypothetical protein HDV01_002218 [Terramyces sp. JEL0728]|nr:hypothetical protein HDV01_002218 [Terramyces sp. JEL0728]